MPYTQNSIFLSTHPSKKLKDLNKNRIELLLTEQSKSYLVNLRKLTSSNHFHILPMNSIKNIGNLKTPILNFLSTL